MQNINRTLNIKAIAKLLHLSLRIDMLCWNENLH